MSIAGAFSLRSLSKAGSIKWQGIRILNVTPIVMLENTYSLILNTISSFFSSIIIFLFTRPELIIISVPPGETALGSYIVAKLFRIKKIVFDYRDEWEDHVIRKSKSSVYTRSYMRLKTIMTKCYSKSNLVITVTDPLARNLSARGVNNIKLVTNGADSSVFKPYPKNMSRSKIGFDRDDFIFVYSGGIGVYYRLDLAIRAAEKVIDKGNNIKLVIVGYGATDELERIFNLITSKGLQNNIFYLGPKFDKTELAEILSASDIGVIPYDANPLWKNSLPSKALEYFACGLPVIATVYTDSLLGRLIVENRVGLISEPENVDALAYNIEKIYSDTLFLREAGERAVSLIKARFERSKIAEGLLDSLLLL